MQEQLPRCARAALPKDSWPESAWSVRRRLLMGDEQGVGLVARARRAADEEGCLLVVVPSSHRVQLGELDRQLERNLGLATEDELRELFKDCEIGAIPPVGAAYGIETVVDESLTKQPEVWFEAGDHELLIHVSGEQFSKLAGDAPRRRFSRHV